MPSFVLLSFVSCLIKSKQNECYVINEVLKKICFLHSRKFRRFCYCISEGCEKKKVLAVWQQCPSLGTVSTVTAGNYLLPELPCNVPVMYKQRMMRLLCFEGKEGDQSCYLYALPISLGKLEQKRCCLKQFLGSKVERLCRNLQRL